MKRRDSFTLTDDNLNWVSISSEAHAILAVIAMNHCENCYMTPHTPACPHFTIGKMVGYYFTKDELTQLHWLCMGALAVLKIKSEQARVG